jgi:hypothetical protein
LFFQHIYVIYTSTSTSPTEHPEPPNTSNTPTMKRYSFFLPNELVDALKLLAHEKDMTYSDLIRKILTSYLKTNGRLQRPSA